MSKILHLASGVDLAFSDESSIENMVTVFKSFADVDMYASNVTTENMIFATFNGVSLDNIIVESVKAEKDPYGNIRLTITNRVKSEIEILKEQAQRQDEMITFLLMKQ